MPTIIPPTYEITGLLPSFQYAGKEYIMIAPAIFCATCGLNQSVNVSLGEGLRGLRIMLEPNHSVECIQE